MKYRRCWNNHGESICQHFQREPHNLKIKYTTDYDQLGKLERLHFIMVLDQSAAMGRNAFSDAKKSAVKFLADAQAAAQAKQGNHDHAVSVILFGATALTVLKQRPLKNQDLRHTGD